jgi:arylsulfatase A-like enzyme
MFRSQVLVLGVVALLGGSAARAAEPARPNILFILTDDQSYKTVGCYPGSYPWAKTPRIDALAAAGVRFDRAYLGAWCMPSRASLLTGLQPHAVESMRMDGTYPGSTYDPKQCRFWPAVFRQHGYHTAQIGKWHTGVDAGFGRDWDYQIVWNRPKHPDNAGNYYYDQILAFNGAERKVEGYATDNYTRWACEYIRGQHRPAGKPWYLWLCYGGVHGPTTPAPRHIGHYKNEPVTPPADLFPPRPGKPDYLNRTQAWMKGPGGVPVAGKSREAFGDASGQSAQPYAAWVRQVNECALALDEGVGSVLAALADSGQLHNTLVVFSADQGFGMGEHGFRSKLAPYDATYASPLIVSMPGRVPAGKTCPHPVNAPDLAVTFCRFAGIDLPWAMHGRDLTPLLRDPGAEWPYPVLFELTGRSYGSDVTRQVKANDGTAHAEVPWYTAVRLGKHKYIRYLRAGEPEELYDLVADPEELTNLAGKTEHAATLAKLRDALAAELERTGAGFRSHLPPTAPTTHLGR